jgi:methyltransferase (TIGR00027 family)
VIAPARLDNPVSLTAYWTLAARYEDAISDRSVAHDAFAQRLMSDEARAVAARFRKLKKPTVSLAVRHRLIDDRLAAELARDPTMRVLIVGCGFDSRAFRLSGGRWVEVDEPEVIRYKDSRLPAVEAQNELVRIAVHFAEDSLEANLAQYAADDRVAVVLEGIVGYLSDEETHALLSTLTRLFPHHVVFCDLLTRTFIERYSRGLVKLVNELGAEFGSSSDHPEELFREHGYVPADRRSVWLGAAEHRIRGAPPAWLLRLLPSMRDGYCVWTFEYS